MRVDLCSHHAPDSCDLCDGTWADLAERYRMERAGIPTTAPTTPEEVSA